MNRRAQIITLDFLISLIAVTLAIGLLIQFTELKTYNEREELQWMALRQVAETAADVLVSNPEITCELVENDHGTPTDPDDDVLISYLNNCLVAGNKSRVPQGQWPPPTKPGWWTAPGQLEKWRKYAKLTINEKMGIPIDGYKCLLTVNTTASGYGSDFIIVRGCLDDPTGISNIYSTKRTIVIYSGSNYRTTTKAELEYCMDNDPATVCNLIDATIELKVWKE